MDKICLTCSNEYETQESDFFSNTEDEIPLWFKKINNYSLLPPPINCNPKFNAFINLHKFKPSKISGANTKINFNLKKIIKSTDKLENRWIFYWAATQRDYNNPVPYKSAPLAYADFRNGGLAKADNNAKISINIQNPQLYKVDKDVFPPHIHFTILNADLSWSLDTWTLVVTPKLNKQLFSKLLGSKKYMVISAMPNDMKKIPNTYNIPFDSNNIQIIEKLDNIPKKQFGNNQLEYIPIIIYCKNPKCSASSILTKKLRLLGFVNILLYPGGIDNYYQ